MARWHLAQLNVAQLRAPIDSPVLADFVANLDRINALADAAPGFVWRLLDEVGADTPDDYPFDNDLIVNLSLWENLTSLHDYVYRSAHASVMSRRKEWFQRIGSAYSVLWWVPEGHLPEVQEARERLDLLRAQGPNPQAFTFKQSYEPESASI